VTPSTCCTATATSRSTTAPWAIFFSAPASPAS
jgi:hypothetical protein